MSKECNELFPHLPNLAIGRIARRCFRHFSPGTPAPAIGRKVEGGMDVQLAEGQGLSRQDDRSPVRDLGGVAVHQVPGGASAGLQPQVRLGIVIREIEGRVDWGIGEGDGGFGGSVGLRIVAVAGSSGIGQASRRRRRWQASHHGTHNRAAGQHGWAWLLGTTLAGNCFDAARTAAAVPPGAAMPAGRVGGSRRRRGGRRRR